MNEEQTQHIVGIIADFKDKAYQKYEIGQAEHGGNLWDTPLLKLLDFALEEAIDQYVYLYTARQKELDRLRIADAQKQANRDQLKEEASHIR